MSKYSIITLLSPLIFIIFWLITFVQFERNEVSAFETWLLTKQVNFSTDAAIEELRTKSPDIAINIEEQSPTVNPDVAVDEFASMLCENLGLPDTAYNRDIILRRYTKCLCVCTNYGYYIYMRKQVTHDLSDTWEFVSWPLLPYTGTIDGLPSTSDPTVAVTLAKDYAYQIELSSADKYLNVSTVKDSSGDPVKLNKAQQLQASEIINNTVTNSMMRALYTEFGNTTDQTVIIPANFDTITGAQLINNTAVLAIVDTSGRHIGIDTLAFGIGGNQIKEADPIIGWYGPDPNWLLTEREKYPDKQIPDDVYQNTYKIRKVHEDVALDQGLPYRKWWVTTSKLKRFCKENDWSVNYVLAGLESERKMFDTKYQAAKAGYDENWAVMGYLMNTKLEE